MAMAARTTTMMMTTSSSVRVKPSSAPGVRVVSSIEPRAPRGAHGGSRPRGRAAAGSWTGVLGRGGGDVAAPGAAGRQREGAQSEGSGERKRPGEVEGALGVGHDAAVEALEREPREHGHGERQDGGAAAHHRLP